MRISGAPDIDPDNIKLLKQEILEEIRKLRLANRPEINGSEKPVMIAGEFRMITEETEFQAIKVEADGFYIKTIRIEH